MVVTGRFNPYFVCSCLPWFPLKIDAYIDHMAYGPGSNIELEINVTNRSFCKIRGFEAQLIKVRTLKPLQDGVKIQTSFTSNDRTSQTNDDFLFL